MKISDNEAHSATYRSENEHFARRCRHYKSKDCKAEFIPMNFDEINKRMEDLRNDGINVLEEFQLGV